MQGPRPTQEDCHIIVDDGWHTVTRPATGEAPACAFFGVFDGHGGRRASTLASQLLWNYVAAHLREAVRGDSGCGGSSSLEEEALRAILVAAAQETESEILRQVSASLPEHVASSGCVRDVGVHATLLARRRTPASGRTARRRWRRSCSGGSWRC